MGGVFDGVLPGCSYCNPEAWRERSAQGFFVMCEPCRSRFFDRPRRRDEREPRGQDCPENKSEREVPS